MYNLIQMARPYLEKAIARKLLVTEKESLARIWQNCCRGGKACCLGVSIRAK